MNGFLQEYLHKCGSQGHYPSKFVGCFYELSSCFALHNATSLNLSIPLTLCYSKCGSRTRLLLPGNGTGYTGRTSGAGTVAQQVKPRLGTPASHIGMPLLLLNRPPADAPKLGGSRGWLNCLGSWLLPTTALAVAGTGGVYQWIDLFLSKTKCRTSGLKISKWFIHTHKLKFAKHHHNQMFYYLKPFLSLYPQHPEHA